MGYTVAIVGATGAVGRTIAAKLEERNFPADRVKFLASARSAGTRVQFRGEDHVVEEAVPEQFDGVDIAFFSAGGGVSKGLAPEAVRRGATVIDNTSAFRMDPHTPLVVPEVNRADLQGHSGLIANPNCSTIQMVCALEPVRKKYGLERVIVSTYQAVSGAGAEAIEELGHQGADMDGRGKSDASLLPVKDASRHYPVAYNAIPQIDSFGKDGYTLEEWKMINETKKILGMPELRVSATCVRLPVVTGHSESVYFETGDPAADEAGIRAALEAAEGVTVLDNPADQLYPMPLFAEGKDDVFTGRLRKDPDVPGAFHLWVVSDNLLKGAALNSIQIAEALIADGAVKGEGADGTRQHLDGNGHAVR
ncbi:aspartate-semialdehyde dehydrogenase [Edaphobacillus lindanitolerans]|uniref:Aspartate-semialdehyde dehydrogenase n=1 Tax=Edaphobacillus lindanitolerans TaxID=550447 RepID=A0A1U7PLB6_9BACI|nr:aspartate-semialdehyde dehydrogenase [Edaphobacillus lindanitolerans]SIT67180.1 aspartate semialdehyde dehydrogenase [Edaphobacillus lindanitolerans]